MSDLPRDTESALAAVAAGWGRVATAAHPDCRCGRPRDDNVLATYSARDCPQHRPRRRAT